MIDFCFLHPFRVYAWALNPENTDAAEAADPIPRTLRLETPS